MRSDARYMCPVCGYPHLDEAPRDEHGGNPSFEICPSCGTEFGYDDASTSPDVLRVRWLQAGAPWSSKAVRKPRDWNPVAQLRNGDLLKDVLRPILVLAGPPSRSRRVSAG